MNNISSVKLEIKDSKILVSHKENDRQNELEYLNSTAVNSDESKNELKDKESQDSKTEINQVLDNKVDLDKFKFNDKEEEEKSQNNFKVKIGEINKSK